jgi:hypothetical protein
LFRIGVTTILLLILVILLYRRTRSLLTTELSLPALALVLEKRYPTVLGDRLITAIEMADVEKATRQGYSAVLVQNTINEARERINQVDVQSVFNWGRLRKKLLALTLISLAGLTIALAAYFTANRNSEIARGLNNFADVATIWGERNLVFWNTPWPRRSLVQLVDFDDEGHPNELRVGKGAAIAPKVSARAFKWVVVERSNPDGWRPLAVKDLVKSCQLSVPNLTLAANDPKPLADHIIDELELAYGQETAVQELIAKLDGRANELWNSRTIRKLVVPSELTMRYEAMQSKARMVQTLNRDATGKYSNDVNGLAESVRFTVSAEDFSTVRRQITLVPPPTLVALYRDEYQPAYLHHSEPILEQEKGSTGGPKNSLFALRGLRQKFAEKKISISSDKSVFSVPIGTELTMTAQADKPLKRVDLKPLTPNVKADALIVPGTVPFDTFQVKFGADNPIRQVEKATEFQILMTDTDNVTSTRTIAIQATDDAPPSVDVIVDPIIRRVAGSYFVTPIARIPFLPESKITDDTGLSSVRFEFKKVEEEAESLRIARGISAISLNSMTVGPVPSWSMPGIVMSSQKLFEFQFGSSIQKDGSGNEKLPGQPLPRFEAQYSQLVKNTLQRVRDITQTELPADHPAATVKVVKLTNPESDAFDFQLWMPELLEKNAGNVQARYKVELFVVAKDINVELTGKDGKPAEPKSAKNLDPIRVLVVSEQDLLAEIAKDEEQQVTRMEDVMKKATDGQVKLSKESALLVKPDAAQIQASQVRVTDIQQDVGKVRDILTTMRTEYEKLYRELDTNRCGPNVIRKYTSAENRRGYLDILKRIFDNSLPKCEESLGAFQGALAAARRPTDDEMNLSRVNYVTLLKDLNELQYEIGVGQDLAIGRQKLKKIIDDQVVLGKGIKDIEEEAQRRLFRPEITLPKVVQIPVGQKANAKVTVNWKLYEKDEVYVAIEAPADSDLKVQKEITIKSDGTDGPTIVNLEVTAGAKPGLHTIRLLPGPYKPGEPIKPIELTIEVTK